MQDRQPRQYSPGRQGGSTLALVMLGIAVLTAIAGGTYVFMRLRATVPLAPTSVAVQEQSPAPAAEATPSPKPAPAESTPPTATEAPAPPAPKAEPAPAETTPAPVAADKPAPPEAKAEVSPQPPEPSPKPAAPAVAPPPPPPPPQVTVAPPPKKFVPPPRTPSEKGLQAGQALRAAAAGQGDVAATFVQLERLAGEGDADAQFHLGEAYRDGVGAKQDRVRALAWFMQAAARGHEGAVLARDRDLASLDATVRVQADSLTRNLPAPMPAGWLADDMTGVRVWSPSWYRNGTFRVRIEGEAVTGFVEGPAKVILTATLPGRSDRTFEGRFVRGVLLDPRLAGQSFELMEADALRLPIDTTGSAAISRAWRQTALNGLAVEACPKATPELYLVAAPGLMATDDQAVKAAAVEAVRRLDAMCPMDAQAPARVFLLPTEHREVYRRGRATFEPRLAELQLYGFDQPVDRWSISITNHAREAEQKRAYEAEQQAKRQARDQKQAAAVAAAMSREMPDIRGLKLGLSFEQFKAALPAEPVAWEPKLEKDHKMPEYNSWWQKVTLKDGTTFTGVFASAQNGSKLVSLAYEQLLRDGPDAESLRQQLYAKYGKADEEAGNRTWLTWWLRSSVNNDPTGAFLKGRLKTGADGKVELLTLSLSDYALARRDEAQAAAARRQADREAIEKKKSDGVKF